MLTIEIRATFGGLIVACLLSLALGASPAVAIKPAPPREGLPAPPEEMGCYRYKEHGWHQIECSNGSKLPYQEAEPGIERGIKGGPIKLGIVVVVPAHGQFGSETDSEGGQDVTACSSTRTHSLVPMAVMIGCSSPTR